MSCLVQLIQIGLSHTRAQYLPYSIGLLQAYVAQHAPGRYRFAPLLAHRFPLRQSLQQISPAAGVLGFSVYVWNIHYSLALAAAVKARQPDALIVFGGPQVPDRAEAWLRAHPQVDVCVHGEGERVFLQLLESLPARDWRDIAGISWLDAGAFRHHPPGARIRDLDEVPSPFLTGSFDGLLAQRGIEWFMLWETNRGCPFSCSFCDWGSAIAAKVHRFSLERLKTEVDWFAARGVASLSLCDANFGILPRDLELTDYVLETRARTGFPHAFSVQNAKNTTQRTIEIHQRLKAGGLGGMVTLSLQSLAPATLQAIRRDNISLASYRQQQQAFSQAGIPTYTDLLIGLPGESYDSFVDGVSRVIAEGQHSWISFYNVFVLPNAELARPDYRQAHGIETVQVLMSTAQAPCRQELSEWQEMVCATATLSRADWCRARAFAWWTVLLYYNFKLLQLPLLLLNQVGGLGWRELLESFSEARFDAAPMLSELHRFLRQRAEELQQGQPLHCRLLQDGLQIWIDTEDFVLTGLRSPSLAPAFFAEVRQLLQALWTARQGALPGLSEPQTLLAEALDESLRLSEALFLYPLAQQAFGFEGRFNLWDCFQAWCCQQPATLRLAPCRYAKPAYEADFGKLHVQPRLAFGLPAEPSFGRRSSSLAEALCPTPPSAG